MHTHWRKTPLVRVHRSVLLGLGLLALVAASCQSPHRPERHAEAKLEPGWPRAEQPFQQVAYQVAGAQVPTIEGAELVKDDSLCAQCHEVHAKTFGENVHRGDGCESCHGPASRHLETRGKEPGLILSFKTSSPAVRAEMCLRCHEQNACSEGSRWRTSKHAARGVSCTDCHRGHYNVPAGTPAVTEPKTAMASPDGLQSVTLTSMTSLSAENLPGKPQLPSLRGTSGHLGALAPQLCYKCHSEMQSLQLIAGPHQIGGPNGFNCTTCHDPHGNILESSRKDLCLQCHKGAPTMAYHASTHNLNGVNCTDCHNPHPKACIQQFADISHTNIRQPKRMPMAVQEPEACFKCHPKVYAMASLPSHHPIKEGKITCSDCHDAHGQLEGNLKAERINLLCYKCHAEKTGPFAYPHPPVTENCAICHEPHGTVANNLLKQPATFLCLRCHAGHRTVHGSSARADIDKNPALRQAFYTDCTNCHTQVHGSDLPSEHNADVMFR